MKAADRLIVALDFPSADFALPLVERLEGQCRWFKVGLALFLAEGPSIVRTLRDRGFDVFLDLKLHDIPNTVAEAVRSVAGLGASLLTVHAAGGPAMLLAAQKAAALTPSMRLLAVTVLTSLDDQQLHATGVTGDAAGQVRRLALVAGNCGIDGLVCSAAETAMLRSELGDEALLVVPGIRPTQSPVYDQRRIATPAQALASGASMLVVGRPVTQSPDPAAATSAILAEMDG